MDVSATIQAQSKALSMSVKCCHTKRLIVSRTKISPVIKEQ
jgi:hypothetical protein